MGEVRVALQRGLTVNRLMRKGQNSVLMKQDFFRSTRIELTPPSTGWSELRTQLL